MPDFTSASWQRSRSDRELAQVVAKGKNLMPAFEEKMAPAGIAAVIEYVRSLATPKPPADAGPSSPSAAPTDVPSEEGPTEANPAQGTR